MNHYNELPYVVINNNGVDVKLYDADLEKYVINEGKTHKNVSYISLDGNKEGRIKTKLYSQYTSLTGRTGRSPVMIERRPDYFGCTLDDSFKTFDGWVSWAETKIGFMCTDSNGNLYQLDKDLLSYPEKNKHYSPDNCVFLPPDVNSGIGQLKRIRHFDTKRKFFMSTFEKYFDTLDEEALGKLLEVCGHDHSLANYEVKTEETLKVRNKYDVLLSKIYNWEDVVDVTLFKFRDGVYSYKQTAKAERFNTAKEAILNRLKPRLEELIAVSKELECDKGERLGQWWRLDEVEKVLYAKIASHQKMIEDIESGIIKLPHYVLTWV